MPALETDTCVRTSLCVYTRALHIYICLSNFTSEGLSI